MVTPVIVMSPPKAGHETCLAHSEIRGRLRLLLLVLRPRLWRRRPWRSWRRQSDAAAPPALAPTTEVADGGAAVAATAAADAAKEVAAAAAAAAA